MKTIHICGVSQETLDRLERLAMLHNRSLQEELRAILDLAVELSTRGSSDPINLHTTNSGRNNQWSRDDLYDDSGR
jgi:plasmid stability protein